MKRIVLLLLLVVWAPSSILVQEEVTMTNISQIFEQAVSFIQQKDPKALNQLLQKTPNYRNIQIQRLPIKPLFTTLFHMLISQVMTLLFGQLLDVPMFCGKTAS